MSDPTGAVNPITGPIHHIGYAIDDLESSIHWAIEKLGAGPFFVLRDVPLQVSSRGEPAVFAHSSAFGRWGGIFVELMKIDRCEPQRVAAAMNAGPPRLNHIAYVSEDLDAASAVLEGLSMKSFLRASLGDIEFTMHDGQATCGHNIELHSNSAGLRGFYQQIHDASVGWDGTDPIRNPQF